MESPEALIEAIKEIRIQYEAEVGHQGRKVWPRSIKERVVLLFAAGLNGVTVVEQTGLPYSTVLKWRPRQKPRGRHLFRELSVAKPEVSTTSRKVATVTVPQKSNLDMDQKIATLTVVTSDGYRLEVLGIAAAVEIIRALRQGG